MLRALAALVILVSALPNGAAPSGPPSGERLTIQRQGARFAAALQLRVRSQAQVEIGLRLRARPPWPDARWRTLRRWRLARTLDDGRHTLRLQAPGAREICRRYAECQLDARASVSLRGRQVDRRRAQRKVATGLWEPDLAAARRYARGRGDVSFAVVDLRSRLRGFHKTRTAPAASTIKATLLVAYLRQRSVRGRALRGDERALLAPMIRVSDNDAAATVATLLGGAKVERFARGEAGMRDFRWVGSRGYIGGNSKISARDEARFLHRLDGLLPNRHRRYARRLLGSVVSWQRWGIADARPRGWRLYFKGGWGINDDGIGVVNHQVAFLERGRCRIALAILTEHNPSTTDGAETQRGIAKRLFRGIDTAPCGRTQATPSTTSLPPR